MKINLKIRTFVYTFAFFPHVMQFTLYLMMVTEAHVFVSDIGYGVQTKAKHYV